MLSTRIYTHYTFKFLSQTQNTISLNYNDNKTVCVLIYDKNLKTNKLDNFFDENLYQ